MADLDELERLLREAPVTNVGVDYVFDSRDDTWAEYCACVVTAGNGGEVLMRTVPDLDDYDSALRERIGLAQAMAAIFNAAPALIAELRALRDLRDAVAEGVARTDADQREYTQSPEDAALEQRIRAALAKAKEAGRG